MVKNGGDYHEPNSSRNDKMINKSTFNYQFSIFNSQFYFGNLAKIAYLW